jgi:hypothetical protein
MKSRVANRRSGFKAITLNILVVSLAVMLLVFSCPVKKLFIKEATPISLLTHHHRPVKYIAQHNDVGACAVKNKTDIADVTVSKEVKLIPGLSNAAFTLTFSSNILFSSAPKALSTGFVDSAIPLFLRYSQFLI